MAIRVWIDGAIVDGQAAAVPVFDRGFLYGDSVYEVARTSGGRCVDLDRHLDRLDRSMASIYMAPLPREVVTSAIARTLEAAGNAESYARVVVTRGGGEVGLDPALADRPRLIVIVRPLALPPRDVYEKGVAVAIVSVVRNARRALDPAVKSGNYLNNVMALAEAKRRGDFYEAVMANAEGRIVEASTSNVFVVKGGVVRTPPLEDGLLDGITRRRSIELLGELLRSPVEQAHLAAGDLTGAEEAFLTSSVRGVVPIVRVDGAPVGDGKPGPVTRDLLAAYDAFLADVAAGKI
jgi:branched-chain amino acid aminotransferase